MDLKLKQEKFKLGMIIGLITWCEHLTYITIH